MEEAIAVGNDLIFDIELEGARQLKHAYPELSPFLSTKLRGVGRRLYGRGTDTEKSFRDYNVGWSK